MSVGYLHCFLPLPLQPLTVTQMKRVQVLIGEASERAKQEMKETEEERHKHLVMIGNVLHPSVPISNDEVRWVWQMDGFYLERTYQQQ